MFSISFQSHLIRHSGTGRTFEDNQRTLEHLRHSLNTRELGTRRALGHLGTWALRHSDTQALEHSSTWVLRELRYLDT